MTNYADKVASDILVQYRGSPNLIGFFEGLLYHADELGAVIEDVRVNRGLLTATGIQLDIIGNIVGVPREVVDFAESIYFGFLEDPTAKEFEYSVSGNADAGRYRSTDENPVQIRKLSDAEYKSHIFSKIIKNSSSITPNDVLRITRAVLMSLYPTEGEAIPVNVEETGNASFTIIIGALLSLADQAFIVNLGLIPRPAGVKITYQYETPPNDLLTAGGLTLFYQDNSIMEIQF